MAKGLTTMKVIAMSLVFMLVIVFVGLTGFIIVSNSTGTMSAIQIGSQAFRNSIKKSTTLIFKNREAEKLHEAAKSVNFPLKAGYYFTNDRILKYDKDIETPSFTISVWIKVGKTDDDFLNVIMSNREPGCQVLPSKYGFSLIADPSDGTIHYTWTTPTNACADLTSPPGTIEFDHWLHVAIVITADENTSETQTLVNSRIEMFINGIKVNSINTIRYIHTGKPLYFGAWSDFSDLFVGRMSTIQFFNEALSEYDIANLSRGSFSFPSDFFKANNIINFLELSLSNPSYIDLKRDHLELIVVDSDKVSKSSQTKKDVIIDDDDIDNKARREKLRKERRERNQARREAHKRMNREEKGQAKMRTRSGRKRQTIQYPEPTTPPEPSPVVETPDIKEEEDESPAVVSNLSPKKTSLRSDRYSLDQFINQLKTFDPIALANGNFDFEIPASVKEDYHRLSMERAEAVKNETLWNWNNYKKYAWGHDELRPVTGNYKDNWGGMGMTLIDSLDTLYLMGLIDEYNEAKEWIRDSLVMEKNIYASTFETNIRVVGGLLAAYDLDKDTMLLDKAKEMADRLYPAFNTPSGYPYASVNLVTGHGRFPSWNGGNAILAELGTMSLEYRYLSYHTKDPKYAKVVNKIYSTIGSQSSWDGLFPVFMNPRTGGPAGGQYTMGASADSYYEYLVKAWIQGGKKEDLLQRLYNEAVEGITSHLMKRSTPSQLLYVADYNSGTINREMGHLACFTGGMLALGVYHNINPNTRERDLKNAKGLAYTCYQMYKRSPIGIGPESTRFNQGAETAVNPGAPYYILRPEAVETLYILNQITGDPIYREWGWEMWQAVVKYTKAPYGHGHIHNVADTSARPDDNEESFWFGETLKYYYLLFNDEKLVDLNKKVFNTECHPLTVINTNGETF